MKAQGVDPSKMQAPPTLPSANITDVNNRFHPLNAYSTA